MVCLPLFFALPSLPCTDMPFALDTPPVVPQSEGLGGYEQPAQEIPQEQLEPQPYEQDVQAQQMPGEEQQQPVDPMMQQQY